MKEAKVMIVIGDNIVGYDLTNMVEFSLKLKKGEIVVKTLERQKDTITINKPLMLSEKSEIIPEEAEKTPVTRVPHTKQVEHHNINEGKMSYDNFVQILESYRAIQKNGEKGAITKLFQQWGSELNIHYKTLTVWFSRANIYLRGNKDYYKSLNSWIRQFCNRYEEENKSL